MIIYIEDDDEFISDPCPGCGAEVIDDACEACGLADDELALMRGYYR